MHLRGVTWSWSASGLATWSVTWSVTCLLTCLLIFAGGLGCSDRTIATDEFLAEYGAAMCRYLVRCGHMPDRATCTSSVHPESQRSLVQPVADAKTGKIHYDAERAAACLERFAGQRCDGSDAAAISAYCEPVFRGKVEPGGVCTSNTACTSGRCALGNCSATRCCMGVCENRPPRAAIGGLCGVGLGQAECVPEAYCERQPTGSSVCKARISAGQPCLQPDACASPAFCRAAPDGTRICALRAKDGQSCADSSLCESQASACDPTDKICKPRPLPGQPCLGGSICVTYAACIAGTCQRRPAAGEACVATGLPPDPGLPPGTLPPAAITCLGDNRCQGGVCVAPPAVSPCPYPGTMGQTF